MSLSSAAIGLAELRAAGVRLIALSNWSAETFPVARERFDFLAWFEGIVISGEVGVNKPDRGIFEHLIERFGIEPAAALFIDDSSANVDAAATLGFRAIQFTDAAALRHELVRLGLLRDVRAGSPQGPPPEVSQQSNRAQNHVG